LENHKKGDKKMSTDTQASDWEFTGITQVSLGALLGGGGYLFMFRSRAAEFHGEVFFCGGGLGAGFGVGQGIAAPNSSGRISYTAIRCSNAFSMADLDNSVGRLVSVGAAILVGGGAMSISAMNISTGVLFDNAGGLGISAGGLNIGANAFVGIWRVGTLMASAARHVSI
jgi:hypothetical protein